MVNAAQVLKLLDAGWTVTRIMDATTWPRRQVELLAASSGMIARRSMDTWVRVKATPRPPTMLEQLVDAGKRSPRQQTRTVAARVEWELNRLEALLLKEQRTAERHAYDVTHIRAWARAAGLNPPTRGRYLPPAIVDAWEKAGRP